jgi:hypothetical protein
MIHQATGRVVNDSSESGDQESQDDHGDDSSTRDSRSRDTDDSSADTLADEDDVLDSEDETARRTRLDNEVHPTTAIVLNTV